MEDDIQTKSFVSKVKFINLGNFYLQSVSELPALVTLKLKNNRLIEYPNDLKNSFGLIKLEELDLSGNDMRTVSKLFIK